MRRLVLNGHPFVLDPARAAYFPEASLLVAAVRGETSLFAEWDRELVRERLAELIGRFAPEILLLLIEGEFGFTDHPQPLRVGDGGLASAQIGGIRFALKPDASDGAQVVVGGLPGGVFAIEGARLWLPWLVGSDGTEMPAEFEGEIIDPADLSHS